MTTSKLLVLVALVLFVLAAVGLGVSGISLGWLGLAFYAGSKLV